MNDPIAIPPLPPGATRLFDEAPARVPGAAWKPPVSASARCEPPPDAQAGTWHLLRRGGDYLAALWTPHDCWVVPTTNLDRGVYHATALARIGFEYAKEITR